MTVRSPARSIAALVLAAAPFTVGAAAPQQVLVFDGRGNGHGVGMAQDSAQAMAAGGQGYEQILQHFYPGTGRARRSTLVRVAVWEAGAATGQVTVTVPGGARVSSDTGSAQARPGATLRITVDGSGYHVREVPPAPQGSALRAALVAAPLPSNGPLPLPLPSTAPAPQPSASTAVPAPPTTGPKPAPTRSSAPAAPSSAPPSSPAAALSFDSRSPVTLTPPDGSTVAVAATGRRYRGRLTALVHDGFRLVDVLDVEDYLLGLGEVPASWPAAALRTQVVAARTYALRAVAAGHPLGYDLCDDTRCQVYLGVQAESPQGAAAVRATRGEVVTYDGGLADTFYSANAGGLTATPGEGFGTGTALPYLPGGVAAPGGVAPWRISAAPQDVAARLGYPGRLDAVVVTGKGPSGRVTGLRLDGSAGSRALSGVDAARRLGLRSTLFTVTRSRGTAQALPAPAPALQLPPTQAAKAVVLLDPEVAAPPASTAPVPVAASTAAVAAPDWPVTAAAMLLVLGVFGAVLGRRAQLTRRL